MSEHPAAAPHETTHAEGSSRFGTMLLVLALVWTLFIAGLSGFHYILTRNGFLENARTAARYSIQKDITYRLWATEHGGVYAPITQTTPPNPYLSHIPERDIFTPSGRPLTLVNPAYMTRQVHAIADQRFGSRGKITSLNPLRPENAADEWQTEALEAFARGASEWSSLPTAEAGDQAFLRVMTPFYAEEGCLRCHFIQGYEVGDLVGGISVSIPWEPYRQALAATWPVYGLGYGGVWLFGLAFIEVHRRRLRRYLAQQYQSYEAQQKLLERLRKLAVHLPGMIYQYRLYPDGRTCFPYSSEGIRNIYGFTPEQLSSDATPVFSVLHPDDVGSVSEKIQQSAQSLDVWHDQYRVRHPDGKLLWIEGHATPEKLTDGSILWHGYIQDITLRKQSEVLLAGQTRELERRNAALEQFNYTVSHELKTPLVTVENLLGFVQKKLEPNPDADITRHIGFIRSATRHMNQLLDSLAQIFRLDAGTPLSAAARIDQLVRDAVNREADAIACRGVELKLEATDLTLCGDRARLLDLWQQLIQNAVKYMGDQAHPVIEIGVEEGGDEPVFYVRDNGIGIEEPYQNKIFGLFDKLEKDTPGSGLGLTLVKRIVEFYAGRIWVESAGIGYGSCFYFTLPGCFVKE